MFKTLFSKEPIEFDDMCETKAVTTAMYLNFDEDLDPDMMLTFVGKAGRFTPIKPGRGGGELLRQKGDKHYAVTGTKGWRWMQSEAVKDLGKEDDIDLDYYRKLVDKAVDHISEFVNYDELVA